MSEKSMISETPPDLDFKLQASLPRIEPALFDPNVQNFIRHAMNPRPLQAYRVHDHWDVLSYRDPPKYRRLHAELSQRGPVMFGTMVLPTYVYVARYGAAGIAEPHIDKDMCEWTVGYCVRQDAIWPFMIDGQPYELKESEAVLYSGTRHRHWRDRIVGSYCDMILFHFMPAKTVLERVRTLADPLNLSAGSFGDIRSQLARRAG